MDQPGIQDFTHVTTEQCIHRDAVREAPVGAQVIRRMAADYLTGRV